MAEWIAAGRQSDLTEAAQSAASKAARDGVAAETQYDVKQAEAKGATTATPWPMRSTPM